MRELDWLKGFESHKVIAPEIDFADYCELDLSLTNKELRTVNVADANALESYVNHVIERNSAKVAMGGYLERRGIYARSEYFKPVESAADERNIHIGLDLWMDVGSSVHALADGTIHSFANNTNHGDYGPTIILAHNFNGKQFYSLYGHLSLESIQSLTVGESVQGGDQIGTLGNSSVNGDYPPHLHFQLILDIGNYKGDYPGVCSQNDRSFYQANCPDPKLFLGI